MKNILDEAIADTGNDRTISDWSNLNAPNPVRPYIPGLMQGLAKLGHKIGAGGDYIIYYRERAEGNLQAAFTPPAGVTYQAFFCMSTTVVRVAEPLAVAAQPMIPVIGIVSDPADEGFTASGNICGISARRHQTAGDCLDHFVDTVPTITTVYAMHKHGYGPSESALARIKARAAPARRNITVTELFPDPTKPNVGITDAASVANALANLPQRNPASQPTAGLLVLPIDVCFANAQTIINTAQGAPYYVPVFFPTPDWVKPAMPSALAGYGVSQRMCGELLAERVDYALQHAGQLPAPLPLPRFIDAPDASFEWWASRAAAAPVASGGLNITLGANAPIVA